jgi:hypothetical protein
MDTKALAEELNQARLARIEAEAANSDVEEMIREVQYMPARGGCFVWVFGGLDEERAVAN